MPKYVDETGLARFYDNISKREAKTFDTVAQMQAATWLKSGMVAHTNGFYAAGDGGAAYYTVGATGTANGMDVLACQGSLKATLVVTEPYVTPEQFGAWGDGTHDDTAVIQAAIDYCTSETLTVAFRNVYQITDTITIANDVTIDMSGATINFSGEYCFHIDGNNVRANIYDGTIVGDNTNTGVGFSNVLRTVIMGTTIRNVMYGVYTRVSGIYGGGCRVVNVTIQNDTLVANSIAILDNGNDNVFVNCIVRDFNIATRTRTGKFYNLHAWVSDSDYYTGSVFAQINGDSSAFTDCVCDSIQFGFYEYTSTIAANCLIANFAMIRNSDVATDALITAHPARAIYNTSTLYPAISGISTEFAARLYETPPTQVSAHAQPTGISTPDLFTNKPSVYTYTDAANGITYYKFGNVAMLTISGLAAQTLGAGGTIAALPTGFNPIGRVEFVDTYGQKRLFLEPSSTGGYLGTQNALTSATLRGSVTYLCQ